jgi:hypothetical protein
MRLSQARAELALARGAWREAIELASEVIDRSRLRHRVKYEGWGLATRARARHRVADRQSSADAAGAVRVARSLGDPATLLECLGVLLDLEGSDAALAEAQRTAQAILAAVSQEALRRTFVKSSQCSSSRTRLPPDLPRHARCDSNPSFHRRVDAPQFRLGS